MKGSIRYMNLSVFCLLVFSVFLFIISCKNNYVFDDNTFKENKPSNVCEPFKEWKNIFNPRGLNQKATEYYELFGAKIMPGLVTIDETMDLRIFIECDDWLLKISWLKEKATLPVKDGDFVQVIANPTVIHEEFECSSSWIWIFDENGETLIFYMEDTDERSIQVGGKEIFFSLGERCEYEDYSFTSEPDWIKSAYEISFTGQIGGESFNVDSPGEEYLFGGNRYVAYMPYSLKVIYDQEAMAEDILSSDGPYCPISGFSNNLQIVKKTW